MRVLLIVSVAGGSAAAAACWPRVACRLAVTHGQPPRRSCPHCHAPFVAGWRGWTRWGTACAACPSRPPTWWIASALAGVAAAGLAWRFPISGAAGPAVLGAWVAVAQAGVLLSLIDLSVQRLPTSLIAVTALAVAACAAAAAWAAHRPLQVITGALAAVGVGGAYLLVAVLAPSQVGMGDVRLATVLAGLLGTSGWDTLVLGVALPYAVALPFALAKARTPSPGARRLSFGPFLITGAIIAAVLTGP